MAKSIRLKPDQESRLVRAAKVRGVSVSDFIREAIDEKCAALLEEESLYDQLHGLIGSVGGTGEGVAARAHEIFGEMVLEKYQRNRRSL